MRSLHSKYCLAQCPGTGSYWLRSWNQTRSSVEADHVQKALACFPLGCQEHLNQRVFQVVHLLEAFAELTDDKIQRWHPRGHRPYVNKRVPILLTILYVKSLEQVPFTGNPTSTKITHSIPKIFSVVTFAQLLLSTPSPKTATSQDPSRSLHYI